MMNSLRIITPIMMSLCLWLGTPVQTQATIANPLTSIDVETPVHFLAPDGSPLVTESHIFSVEAAEDWIRLVPEERQDALLIEAKKGTHELELADALALSVPDTEDGHSDLHHILLLLPDGKTLEATGTYSGIRPRGLFGKVAKNIKKRAQQAYKKARSSTKKATSKTKAAASKAKRQVELGARISAHKIMLETMKQSIKEANRDKKHFHDKLKKANKKKQQLLQKLKNKNLPKQAKERLKQELKNLDDANKKLNYELQKVATRFNQAQQALSKTMKTMNEMQKAIIKNM
ncbi:MAG: hypothetical protein ACPGYT_06850 [Nitrospirales bacterium]